MPEHHPGARRHGLAYALVPRCPHAGSSEIRCARDTCDECAEIRGKVERLAAMNLADLADYCTSVLRDHGAA